MPPAPPDPDESESLARSWLAHARNPEVATALESIYARVAAEIESRGPACWASGRCCNFDQAGHRLYVTGLEAAYTVARLDSPPPSPTAPTPPRVQTSDTEHAPTSALSLPQIAAARAGGGCPFQRDNLCTVHPIKPLGCRVYFCDRSAQDWQHDLTERMLQELRALHDRFHIEYRYAEWRAMLESFAK